MKKDLRKPLAGTRYKGNLIISFSSINELFITTGMLKQTLIIKN